MATESSYLLDPETLDPVPLYDPRYRRRRHYSYDPRRRRRTKSRRQRRFRMFGSRVYRRIKRRYRGPSRKTVGAKLNKTLNKVAPSGVPAIAFLATVGPGDRAGLTGVAAAKAAIASAVTRVTGGWINLFGPLGVRTAQPVTMYASGWTGAKAFNNWTWGGIGAWLYGKYIAPAFGLPFGPVAKKTGRNTAFAGFIGGSISELTGDPAGGGVQPYNIAQMRPASTPLALPAYTAGQARGRYS